MGKVQIVGFERFLRGVKFRYEKGRFIRSIRAQAMRGAAETTWNTFAKSYKEAVLQTKMLSFLVSNQSDILFLADQYCTNTFSFLGSRAQSYLQMPWYYDVRLAQHAGVADSSFDSRSFYADIPIIQNDAKSLGKDIKVPWEFARFQWAPILAQAYVHIKQEKYLIALKSQINSWIDACPYLFGIHWINPMEVAIRAANWIIAYQLLGEQLSGDQEFFRRFVCSLYDHMRFIENNWEWYDGRTNNHYLCNLVGFGYLSWLFNDFDRLKKIFSELGSEFNWQIFDEGSSYEGSTKYHRLVTELFLHGFLIAKQIGEPVSQQIIEKLRRMVIFAERSKSISIGDEDGGVFMHPALYDINKLFLHLTGESRAKANKIQSYPQFGITFINDDSWHISLRNHAYHLSQPAAHFHEDVASVTVSFCGIPILIDPGSYVYTASSWWRNYFRSIQQHSCFYPEEWHAIANKDLFSLGIEPHVSSCQGTDITHSFFGFKASRSIALQQKALLIFDSWESSSAMRWAWVFSSEILVEAHGHSCWLLRYKNEPLLVMQSPDLCLQLDEVWSSQSYGIKQKTIALRGTYRGVNRNVQFRFYPA